MFAEKQNKMILFLAMLCDLICAQSFRSLSIALQLRLKGGVAVAHGLLLAACNSCATDSESAVSSAKSVLL